MNILPIHSKTPHTSWATPERSLTYPNILLAIYAGLFIICAMNPIDRTTWWVENITVLLVIALIALASRSYVFSKTAYSLMIIFLFLHTVGGHYTFEKVPFQWFDQIFGFQRNQYDRVAHVTVGFYAYAICEFLDAKRLTRSAWITALFGIFAIGTVAMTYEIVEWIYASLSDPAAGAAYLGSQGDIWDAQKDMLSDISGAILAVLFYIYGQRSRHR
jgi:putative membrane protein